MIAKLIGFIFVFPILIFSAVDDDWGDIDNVEVIESTNQKNQSFRNYWDEHVYGSISGMVSVGQNHSRRASEVKIGFNDHWKTTKIVIEGAHRQNNVHTKYDTFFYNSDISNARTRQKISGDINLGYNSLDFRQAYVSFYPIQNMTLSVGKQIHVWGQLDVFSPIDFLLPLDINPMGFSVVKADNRMPQTSVKLQVYPRANIELTGYYFPIFEENSLSKSVSFGESYSEINGKKYYSQKIIPSKNKQASSAIRATWYANNFTWGITYYNGFNNIFPIFKSKYWGIDEYGFKRFISEYGYYKKQGLGLELNVPFGKVNLKGEVAISDEYVSIDNVRDGQMADILNEYNNGYSEIPTYMSFYAVGIDADFDRWFINFYLLGIFYVDNPKMSDFWAAYENETNGPFNYETIPIFPALNIGRYLSSEKKGAYGLALGYFTGGLGAFAYISNQINESLSWGFSADFGATFSDLALFQEESDDDSYTEYKFVEPKLTFGLGYKI